MRRKEPSAVPTLYGDVPRGAYGRLTYGRLTYGRRLLLLGKSSCASDQHDNPLCKAPPQTPAPGTQQPPSALLGWWRH